MDTLLNFSELEQLKRPWVIAHRGYKAKYPENTIAAFEAAIDVKADMIELDICLTHDRVPVVIHDNTLDRTTNGSGIVQQFSLEELKKLDAGSWFSPEFKGEPIPTLQEVLQLSQGRIAVNIEIKPESLESPSPVDAIEKQVCEMVKGFGMEESVLISSFEHVFFFRMERWLKAQSANLFRFAPLQNTSLSTEFLLGLCHRKKAYSFHPAQSLLSKELVHALTSNGFRVLTFTVNDPKRMKQLIEIGVTGIITDEPELMMNMIAEIS